ncbi:isoprenylcysteine carboxyl methyltransferase family protein [Halobacillus campisalis]|uniref:Isoprenylcysteine carboxyl methyltransferase family protein n=1 Tax=Halobacillus campisalis TaxID=435909 RepID=A0ABW2K3C8_9BACI|nr:isoprenylcysteine carboxylmethyltransferase family protein [Halobacillus campisalis]
MWLFIFLVIQRVAELIVAHSNKKWMFSRGGVEVESRHYFLFIVLHVSFFSILLFEWFYFRGTDMWLSPVLIVTFVLLQILRIWCILSLGRRWNTKIIVIPNEHLVERGPYRYIKHPNYIIVFLELLIIPLLFQAYFTAIVFPLLHLLVLTVRIPAEERALEGEF